VEHSGLILCPVCGGADLTHCLSIPRVPVFCNVLYPTREAALAAPTGSMDLRFCPACGHLHNAAFDPATIRYSADYENSLHHSPRFQDYARELARDLHARHGLAGKTVVEIASGQGDFLRQLSALTGSLGIGFDPAYRGAPETVDGVAVIPQHYSEDHARRHADLIVCRHALEHLADPAGFLQMVRRAIGERPTAVYFEVPDARFTLGDLGVWDLIYEHCGYFSRESLNRLFQDAGFRVDAVDGAFGGQFLGLHGQASDRPGGGRAVEGPALAELGALVDGFAGAYRSKLARWHSQLSAMAATGQRAVVWGAGSKGVSLVNTLAETGGDSGAIAGLVDINPHKQGRFVPGTGHPVVSPEALARMAPDRVIVLNPQYRAEIAAALDALGVSAELLLDLSP
jgi:hypothetical protein